jgi:hypothetical protein
MKTSSRSLRKIALVGLLVAMTICLVAYDRTADSLKRPDMTTLSPRLQSLFEHTKNVCFGHFIVEVPATATVAYGPAEIDFPIHYYQGEGDKVDDHVKAQLLEVEKDRDYLREGSEFVGKDSLFGKVIDGVVPGQKLVFGSNDHVFYSIESFIPAGKDLFVQRATSVVSTADSIKSLNTAASLLRLRAADEVPAESGACIEGGFVGWKPEFERASVEIRLKEFPDVHFSVEVSKNQDYLVESSALEPLLDRAAKEGGLWYSRVKFFRRGPRQLGRWTGFEALARKPAQPRNTESHEFAFISLGALRDSLQPELDVKLDTGVKDDQTASVKPSITDEEAVALWDKLIGSIRLRPTGAEAKQSSVTPPRMPLGEYVDTGSICPQSGWWQCSEGGEIAGGRRRYFAAGDLVPHAFVLGKPRLWQLINVERPTQKVASIWKLVEYDRKTMVESPNAVGATQGSGTYQTAPSYPGEAQNSTPPGDA